MATGTWRVFDGRAREWVAMAHRWMHRPRKPPKPSIGLALGGGFARGIAHIGVLRVLEQHQIPIGFIAGVSAGAIVASAYASGTTPEEIEQIAEAMKFRDIGRWSLSRLGLLNSNRMIAFLKRLLKVYTFEEMRIPLAMLATDLSGAKPVIFRDRGDVFLPIRASCAYPGLFQPIRYENYYLVDGAITMEIPALPLREMGATHIIAVALPMQTPLINPRNMFGIINQCFQILQTRTEWEWRKQSDVVITPEASDVNWDSFGSAQKLIEAGEMAALAALSEIQSWLNPPGSADVTKPMALRL